MVIKSYNSGQFGYVGIGTTTPSAKLEVNAGSIKVTAGDQAMSRLKINNTAGRQFDLVSGITNIGQNGFSIYDNTLDATRLVIDNSGNVGIGITNPTDKLAVNGIIHAKEVRVDLVGWPDYVFANTYNLKSLSSVEQYINKNGHLPDVPSAIEVEEKGLELSKIAKMQQEKIEELTLYLIQQNKEIQELKSQVKAILSKK